MSAHWDERNWRWTCPCCGASGWEVVSRQGDIPSHDRADGRRCRQWDDQRLMRLEARSYAERPRQRVIYATNPDGPWNYFEIVDGCEMRIEEREAWRLINAGAARLDDSNIIDWYAISNGIGEFPR